MSTQPDTNRALSRVPLLSEPGEFFGDLIQVAAANLTADFSTTAVVPTYSTLLTRAFVSALPASFLNIVFYASGTLSGLPAMEANVRFRLNGTLLPPSRAVSQGAAPNTNNCLSFSRRVAITSGLQTVVAEIALVTGPGLIAIPVASVPDEYGAHMLLQETR